MKILGIQEHPENLAVNILGIPKIRMVFHINTGTIYQQCEEEYAKIITGPFSGSQILK